MGAIGLHEIVHRQVVGAEEDFKFHSDAEVAVAVGLIGPENIVVRRAFEYNSAVVVVVSGIGD